MGQFTLCEDHFACGGPTQTTLVFVRASRAQNSAGELVLSFASALSLSVDLQPETGRFPRLLHGTLTEVHYTAIAFGGPDVRVGDRTTISGAAVEVVHAAYFGGQVELALQWVR